MFKFTSSFLKTFKQNSYFTFCQQWERINIPIDKVKMSFSRSSGAGGQNVNKLNTKAELRFHIESADWLSEVCKKQLVEQHPNKINNEGFFIMTCQEHRTQEQNKRELLKKVQFILDQANILKCERIVEPFVEPEELEEKRIKEKKIRSETKKFRRGNVDF